MLASTEDRKDLFLRTANRIGTTLENIEKDFWVCWTLDLLFNAQDKNEPRLLFKGGTSLSKAYGLISRFSEDIDITVFREDLGQNYNADDLRNLSRNKQQQHLDEIRNACQNFIQQQLYKRLSTQINECFSQANINHHTPVVIDPDDPDKQTLLIYYPSVSNNPHDYIQPTIKIEAGAKSALDPHQNVSITPYISSDLPSTSLQVSNIVTIDAARTFWDKIIILHGLRSWYDNKREIRLQSNRVSRHYYDVFKLINSDIGEKSKLDHALALHCAEHASVFFNRKPLDLELAKPGSYKLMPTNEMIPLLKRDYGAMTNMIFGEVPEFDRVINAISELEKQLNAVYE